MFNFIRVRIYSILLTASIIGHSITMQAQLKIGDAAPEIRLPDSIGKWTALSEVKATYVLIDFWAAWCPPCIVMAQELKKIKEQNQDDTFKIFALSLDRDYRKWVAMVRKLQLPFIHVNDAYGLKSPRCNQYGVQSIPSKFLLKEGKVIAINPTLDQIKEMIAQ